jgi:uncharacterized membrane protein YjgN (DUF898 family)
MANDPRDPDPNVPPLPPARNPWGPGSTTVRLDPVHRGPSEARPRGPGGHWIETASAGFPRDRLQLDVKFGELLVLFIQNFLLAIVTLGIYRFWGKTRIRRYLWSHTGFRGERFEYSGRGLELFLGFLVAFFFIGVPSIGISLWFQFDPPTQPDDPRLAWLALGLVVFYIVFFYLLHVGTFAAYRYRLTRTSWRGIRGVVTGSAWSYGWLGFGLSLLNGLSLGWTRPWSDSLLWNYRLARTSFGTVPAKGELNTQGLYGPFAIAWVISFVVGAGTIAIIFGLLSNFTPSELVNAQGEPRLRFVVAIVVAYLIIPVTWLVTVNWYRAALIRKIAQTYTLSGLAFECPVRGAGLLWLNVGNFLILLLSLGLLFPWALLRLVRYAERHLRLNGEIDYAAMRQSEAWRPGTGEGMAEIFGFGVI